MLQDQERIRGLIQAGKVDQISNAFKHAKIGVVIEANSETLDSVPYLTHQDFVKQIKELTELCDYVVVSLASGGTGNAKSNGLYQYYTNPASL